MYEMWPSHRAYDRARQHWKQLTASERRASGLGEAGHLGSTIVFLPKRQPYFAADKGLTPCLVLPDPAAEWGQLQIISEVLEGVVCPLAASALYVSKPWRELGDQEHFCYLKIRNVPSSFAAMNALDLNAPADALAKFPIDAHGRSGSDWRVTVVGPEVFDSHQLGLMRFAWAEPWRDRVPALGFSAPARVEYLPPVSDSMQRAGVTLVRAGALLCVCDPWAVSTAFTPLEPILRSARILTRERQIAKNFITKEWAHKHGVEVKVQSNALHDRFVVGSRHAFLIGTSLNGIGNSHSFLIELDAVMRVTVRDVFEELWSGAREPW